MAKKNPGTGKKLTREEWKKKYGSDTQYYTNTLDKKDIHTGKTIRQIINEKAKKFNVDPAFLASTLFTEGLDWYDQFDEKSNPFTAEQYVESSKGYPVSGMRFLGMDTVGNRKQELIKLGLLKKEEYDKNVIEVSTKNEKGQEIISGDFKDLDYGIEVVAAFHKMENDKFDAYVKEQGIELTPLQRTFFRNVAYNAGEQNGKDMVSSYHKKGYLKNHDFIYNKPDDSWEGPWTNANKRTTAGTALRDTEEFVEAPGQPNNYISTPNVELASQIEAKGLMDIEAVKAIDKVREEAVAANSINPKGLASKEMKKLTAAGIDRAPNLIQKTVNSLEQKGLASVNNPPKVKLGVSIPLKTIPRKKVATIGNITPNTMRTSPPTEPTPAEKAVIDKFVANMQKAIGAHESGNKYDAKNPLKGSTASGKYQFTKYWLTADKDKEKSIQSFAKRNGFDVPQNMQDFMGNPQLQDSYFKFYAKEILYPKAVEAVSTINPKGISLEQAAGLVHFKGATSAINQISTGKFDAADPKNNNPSSLDYLNSIAKKVDQPTTAATMTKLQIQSLPQAEKDKIAKEYFDKKDEIIHFKDLDDIDKNRQIAKLNSEFKAKGYIPVINDYVAKRNEENKTQSKAKDDQIRKNVEEFEKWGEKTRITKTMKDGKPTGQSSQGTISLSGPKEAKEFKEWAKANGVKISEKSNFMFSFDTNSLAKAGIKALTGKTEISDKQLEKMQKAAGTEGFLRNDDMQKGDVLRQNNFAKIASWFTGETPIRQGSLRMVPEALDYATKLNSYTEIAALDEAAIEDLPVEAPTTEGGNDPETSNTNTGGKTTTKTETEAATTEADKTEPTDKTQEWINTELGLLSVEPNTSNYDAGAYKKKINFDAITGMAMGLIGNEDAKRANIPLRTEQVSEAVKNYTAELAKKSREGLPVEVEAAMKNQLAEAYQGGLRNIVNASAGNRATVLGNQGQLEVAKNKGIVDIQLADYEAKERAFQQYGQAIQYENDFNARRDIANHGIKYQQGLLNQHEGKQLAQAGFTQLTEALKYQRENGPGSANHMYRSKLMQEMFGFDPEMKDDGSGTVQGTKSFRDKGWAELKERKGLVLNFQEKVQTLNPNQKALVNKLGGPDQLGLDNATSLIEHLRTNPELDLANMNMENIDQAIQKQDWGLLAVDRSEAIESKPKSKDVPGVVRLTERKEKENNDWMNNDFGNGVNADGSPAAPPTSKGIGSTQPSLATPPILAQGLLAQSPGVINLTDNDIATAEPETESPFDQLNAYTN